MNEGEDRCIQGFWLGHLRKGAHLEDPGRNGRLKLNGSSGNGMGRHGLD